MFLMNIHVQGWVVYQHEIKGEIFFLKKDFIPPSV